MNVRNSIESVLRNLPGDLHQMTVKSLKVEISDDADWMLNDGDEGLVTKVSIELVNEDCA